MSRPIIGLLINYRNARLTAGCARALLDNDVERVLVWDNSEDDGFSSAELHRLFSDDPRVAIEISPRNLGFAAGVNRGIEACRILLPNAWVLLINNDAVAPSNLSVVLSTELEHNRECLLAFPTLMHAGGRIDEVYYHRWLGLLAAKGYPGAFRIPRGCCLMLATDRLDGQLFDEDFFMYGEEIELGWRLRDSPTAMIHAEGVAVVHEGSASSGRNSLFYETHIAAAHLLLAHKLGSTTPARRFLKLIRVLGLLARATVRSMRYRSLNPWKGLLQGVVVASRKSPSRRSTS